MELLEQTSAEVPDRLRQADADPQAIDRIVGFLEGCDRVKFAAQAAGSDECREAIELAYGIVDATRPKSQATPATGPVEGAA